MTRTVHTLASLFRKRSAEQRDAAALVVDGSEISFGDLDLVSDRLAAFMARNAVDKGDVVAIQLGKGVLAYALIIACLKRGAPYVFIDPKSPPVRRDRICDRCQPKLLFASEQCVYEDCTTIALASTPDERAFIEALPMAEDPDRLWDNDCRGLIAGTDPAYVMFTSGSTGDPKGAAIPHMGVLSLCAWARDDLGIGPGSRLTAINPLHFDNSVFDLYGGLFNGAALVPVETATSINPREWVRTISEGGCTFFFAVPTLFLYLDKLGMLTPDRLPSVKSFMFGGEGFPIDHLKRFFERFSNSELINVYGPTETSCICSSYRITEATFAQGSKDFAPLGRMHANFLAAILDENCHPVAPGGTGELWIGGPCVGLGYYNDPDATESRFRQLPGEQSYRSIWYRTGDLVMENASSGELEFRGRADNQIKLRGHRIELEEIENAISGYENVLRCVVFVRQAAGWDGLSAVVEATPDFDLAALKAHCEQRLPNYMRPEEYHLVAALPVNANGKIDRRAVSAEYGKKD